jgi:nicotinamide mononucleotide (NMN) deamidase PncC
VFTAVAMQGSVRIERFLYGGRRRAVRERAAAAALDLCRRVLEE